MTAFATASPSLRKPKSSWLLGLAIAALVGITPAHSANAKDRSAAASAPISAKCITEGEVLKAQKAWGEGIISIGKTFTQGGDYTTAAAEHIDKFY
jgi:hypothetical protein